MKRIRAALLAVALVVALGGCGDDNENPSAPGPLPPQPAQVEPAAGASLDTDTPIFTVQNANGFDSSEIVARYRLAEYGGRGLDVGANSADVLEAEEALYAEA